MGPGTHIQLRGLWPKVHLSAAAVSIALVATGRLAWKREPERSGPGSSLRGGAGEPGTRDSAA